MPTLPAAPAAAAGGLRRPPRALPGAPRDLGSWPGSASLRCRPRPRPVLPGRTGREPPVSRGNRPLPARRGRTAASADSGRVGASEGWGPARGIERPGSCHFWLRDSQSSALLLGLAPRTWWGGEEDERGLRAGTWSREGLARNGPRHGRGCGHRRPAAPDRREGPALRRRGRAGPGHFAGGSDSQSRADPASPLEGFPATFPTARRLPSVTKFSPCVFSRIGL